MRHRDRLAVDLDLAGVGGEHAGDDLRGGRLAGAVVPDECDDLVRVDLEVDADEGLDGAEVLAQLADGEPGRLPAVAGGLRGVHRSLLARPHRSLVRSSLRVHRRRPVPGPGEVTTPGPRAARPVPLGAGPPRGLPAPAPHEPAAVAGCTGRSAPRTSTSSTRGTDVGRLQGEQQRAHDLRPCAELGGHDLERRDLVEEHALADGVPQGADEDLTRLGELAADDDALRVDRHREARDDGPDRRAGVGRRPAGSRGRPAGRAR